MKATNARYGGSGANKADRGEADLAAAGHSQGAGRSDCGERLGGASMISTSIPSTPSIPSIQSNQSNQSNPMPNPKNPLNPTIGLNQPNPSAEKIWNSLKNPPAEYRSLPFWSWNDALDPDELVRQIEEMAQAGAGGFFMHARGGLRTPYMGEAWMDAVRLCLDKARELGLKAWLYDENGWPSGTADGTVPAKGLRYQQKRLVCRKPPFDGRAEGVIASYAAEPEGWRLLPETEAERADLQIAYEVNPYYTDTLSREAVRQFIAAAYEPYWRQFGETYTGVLQGVFTDEPQFARGGLPWSAELEAVFASRTGKDVKTILPWLFHDGGPCRKARYDYWECVTHMFADAYARQIGEWCASKGWVLTGHVVDEQELTQQVTSVGDPMAFYAHMQMPGCDWLGRFVGRDPVVPKQVGSAARQTGARRTITESFGCAGWNVGLDDLKRIGEWQFAYGINSLCQHLQSYTLRGLRKRDYPPSLFYQQPWWKEYKNFNDYFARLSLLLSESSSRTEVLLLHPVRSAWVLQRGEDSAAIQPYHDDFARLSVWLCRYGIEHDYGSESLIAASGRVSGGLFEVGKAVYRTVVLPPAVTLARPTIDLLLAFTEQGGSLIALAPYPELADGEPDEALNTLIARAVRPAMEPAAVAAAVCVSSPPFIRRSGGSGGQLLPDELHIRSMKLGEDALYYVVNTGTEHYSDLGMELGETEGIVSVIDLERGVVVPFPGQQTGEGAEGKAGRLGSVEAASEGGVDWAGSVKPGAAEDTGSALERNRDWPAVAEMYGRSLSLSRISDGALTVRVSLRAGQSCLLRVQSAAHAAKAGRVEGVLEAGESRDMHVVRAVKTPEIGSAANAVGIREMDSRANAVGIREIGSAANTVGIREIDSTADTVGVREMDSAANAVGKRETGSTANAAEVPDTDIAPERFRPPHNNLRNAERRMVQAQNVPQNAKRQIELAPEWEIAEADLNSLTLDYARLRVSGGEWTELLPVIFIQERLLAYGKPVGFELEFSFEAAFDTDRARELYLVLERPEEMAITLNGAPVASQSCGWWRDSSLRMIDVRRLVHAGANTLRLAGEFRQSPEMYEQLERAKRFEAEGNKLTFDWEIEPIYLLGQFGVRSDGAFTDGERQAVWTDGGFELTEPPQRADAGDLTRQGFPFFAGSLRLRQTIRLEEMTWAVARWCFIAKLDTIAAKLFINGLEVKTFLWEPYTADISSYLRQGDNLIELELTGSCRNLLGPHHHILGELYKVGPDSYKDKPGWTDKGLPPGTMIFQDRYTFVRFGLNGSPVIEFETRQER
ncbi:glycosyl hydrolase [Paenibacillus sp. CN-4]|uniref:glycosyl hydrolase n=1 Tax=Paenibacillus nanchangensis TaxID=3348343 RepID=UPI00397BEC93